MPPTRGSKAEMKKILDVSFCNTIQKKIDASSRSVSSCMSTVGTLAIPLGEAQHRDSDYWRQGLILQPWPPC